MPTEPPPEHPPEMVGATDDRVELAGQPVKVEIPLVEAAGPARRRGAAEAPTRIYLNVDNIEAERNPGGSYGVYLNVPDDDDDPTNDAYHVGNISFFGIEYASDLDQDPSGGHGMRFAFDVTDLVEDLRQQNRWDPERVTVTFAPLRRATPRRRGVEVERTPVSLGRVSFFVQ